ncbi:bifunctional proline dehydrogenase/L-glutamate gamma-semialdehyde dehydrogenase, partial [Escherichia coli]|nr:bifunctional proline dehydrogenase/L-glutamate gamma-semialdehyde dehydrogenase [Escherichia coli]
ATHNAHTVAAVLDMATDPTAFEFQRLHGMGEALHDIVLTGEGTRCRIYAPVGAHRDLLAYLVRRLLENGANSSFVNQIVNDEIPPEDVAGDPFAALGATPAAITTGPDLFMPQRKNSVGFDLTDIPTLARIDAARDPLRRETYAAVPLIAGPARPLDPQPVTNPYDPADSPGTVADASPEDVETALA